MRLRAQGQGMVGEGMLTCKRSDPQHEEVLRHVGGIRPGQTKPVPPRKD